MNDQPVLFGPPRDVQAVVIDPPWDCEAGGGGKGANAHYDLLSPAQVVRVIQQDCPHWQRLADTAHVWIWVTNTTITNGDAHRVAEGLGVRPITVFTWVKRTTTGKVHKGIGQYSYGSTEHLWLCRRGDYLPVRERFQTVFDAPVGKHSAKPDASYEMIEQASHPNYLEIFARRERPGWTVWGNEV